MALRIRDEAIAALQPSSHDGGKDDTVSHVKAEEIIFIAEKAVDRQEYAVFTLRHGSKEDGEEPFILSAFSARPGSLSQAILDQHLLGSAPDFIRPDSPASLDVIVSGGSGTGQALKFFDSVLQPLLGILGLTEATSPVDSEQVKKRYQVTVTKSAETVKQFAHERWGSNSQQPRGGVSQTIVLLSGDGAVVDLLNGSTEPNEATGPRPVIALLPLGTGNAAFHSLHKPHYTQTDLPVPSPFVLGLRTILRGKAAPLPTFQATFSPGSRLIEAGKAEDEPATEISHLVGAIVASYGFHSQLVWESDTPAYRVHGDKRFGMVARELLKEGHAYDAVVETRSPAGSKRLGAEKFNYILATMVSNLEKAFTISPESKPLDGQLRLVHFGDVGGAKSMEIMMKAYDGGKHVDMQWTTEDGREERVGYDAVDEVKVTTLEEDARWRKICIDGTIVEIPRHGSMTVKKTAEPRFQVLVG